MAEYPWHFMFKLEDNLVFSIQRLILPLTNYYSKLIFAQNNLFIEDFFSFDLLIRLKYACLPHIFSSDALSNEHIIISLLDKLYLFDIGTEYIRIC